MSIYIIPFNALLSFVLTAANIIEFFLLVRAVMLLKNLAWLKPFDTAGKDLTVSFTSQIDRLFCLVSSRHLSERGRIIVGFALLELIKVLICGFSQHIIYCPAPS